MKVCDICKNEGVRFDNYTTINEQGGRRCLELCCKCYAELRARTKQHEYLAYTETIEAMTGKAPRKSHWWDIFKEDIGL